MPFLQAATTSPPPATTSCRPLLPINLNPFSTLHIPSRTRTPLPSSFAVPKKSDSEPDPDAKLKARRRRSKPEEARNEGQDPSTLFPTTIPRRPRRGRRSEAAAVEDFVRDRLEKTFASIRQQNPDVLDKFGNVMKERAHENSDSENDQEEEEEEEENDYEKKGRGRRNAKMVVEEESSSWPLDADVGWGIRASEYFEKHSIKNVVGEDGVEIDWEGEVEDSWVKEINCLEWESFAFHPSPLVVLVFERYNNATDNWKTLKELEKAVKVYWSAKDWLPPRMVKFDVNIEKDMAYALKVKECPQILFLRGHRIMYREKEFRTADELVQMIAHFYYNAKKPLCMKDAD